VAGWMRVVLAGLVLVGILAIPCGYLALLAKQPWSTVVFALSVAIWVISMLAMGLLLSSLEE